MGALCQAMAESSIELDCQGQEIGSIFKWIKVLTQKGAKYRLRLSWMKGGEVQDVRKCLKKSKRLIRADMGVSIKNVYDVLEECWLHL